MSLIGLATKAASGKVVLGMAAALLVATSTAGWALWRLAGAGPRCELRIAVAAEAGNAELRRIVNAQVSALALLEHQHGVELAKLRSAGADRAVERVVVYRDRIERVEVPFCAVVPEQIAELMEVLR